MIASQVFEITITSTARDAYDQARVMYDNIAFQGTEAQKALYACHPSVWNEGLLTRRVGV
jgi:hypothetical protein